MYFFDSVLSQLWEFPPASGGMEQSERVSPETGIQRDHRSMFNENAVVSQFIGRGSSNKEVATNRSMRIVLVNTPQCALPKVVNVSGPVRIPSLPISSEGTTF